MTAAKATRRPPLDVAVIGAGAAGLAAARTLRDAGWDPIVLEARSRIGGRAQTVRHGGVPLDRGCGWLHSGDRNPWRLVAEELGLTVDRSPSPWGRQTGGIGFSEAEQDAFRSASDAFYARLEEAAATGRDRPAADLLEPSGRWNGLLDAIGTYINGTELARVSVTDFDRYADTGRNWRVRDGYGALVARYGADIPVRLDTPVTVLEHAGPRLRLDTPAGTVEVDRTIVAVPSTLLAGEGLRFTPALPAKVEAAAHLPLGIANKIYLGIDTPEALPREGHLFGRVDRVGTGSYHINPLGRPVIEGYYGGTLAAELERGGPEAFAAFALDELARLLGADIRRHLTPILSTAWATDPWSLGSYSHALPGHADARAVLAAPVDGRLFFAGEACSRHDFSTAHGAYRTGVAAAEAVLVS